MTVERYYNEKGELGVLVSVGYGAGWGSLCSPECAYDARLVKAALVSKEALIEAAHKHYPDHYDGGLDKCVVKWVRKGLLFRIDEYDGAESLEFYNADGWTMA